MGEHQINLLSPLTPVEENTFAIKQERAARAWIDAGEFVSSRDGLAAQPNGSR